MAKTSGQLVQLNSRDTVAVVIDPAGLAPGTSWHIGDRIGQVVEVIPTGHKIATQAMAAGELIIKYGQPIAIATQPILPGAHVHLHNIAMPPEGAIIDSHRQGHPEAALAWEHLPSTYLGYRRQGGGSGTRNVVVVAATVNCSATVAKRVCEHFRGRDLVTKGIDAVVPLTHGSGCAQTIGGEAYQVLNRTLAGSIFHPNVVGALVIGLGCEGTTLQSILDSRDEAGLCRDLPIVRLDIQDSGGTKATIQKGIALVEDILGGLPAFTRERLPVRGLRLALNCGGSDAFSGLTANPALGVASDILAYHGGTVGLAEIPECHGAEGLLLDRAQSPEVRHSLLALFQWWKGYAERHQVALNDNLSPGNMLGGITTILEKSLGAVAKAGTSPLAQVVDYAMPLGGPGFVLMNTPGFDPVSVTGLVAGGCNLVAFTTGRGSVYGCALAPTVKIATNTATYLKLFGDMDLDAGRVLDHGDPTAVGIELYQLLIRVASGEVTCSERLGLGWEEFVPWASGETL